MITGEKIENLLKEAWEKFCDYYDTKAPRYRKSWLPKLKKEKDAHWICWNEYDLTFHIGRFFYDILKKKEGREFSNIEIHFEKNVNFTNFKDYDFFKPEKDKLEKFKEELKKIGRKRGPKVDMIVAYEDKSSPFLLCAEVKHFHYASERYNEKPDEKIDVDIKKLKVIRDCGIAKRIVFMLFDDYYWYNDEEIANAIQQRLDEIRNENGITVLFHKSEAKLDC
jgi:hypothetical protein